MDLSKAHHFFQSRFRTAQGLEFQAQLLAAPMEESSVYFFLPRRLLKLDAASPVQAGHVVTSLTSGHTWLTAENGPSEYQGREIYKSLKLFEVTDPAATWKVTGTSKDPITGLDKKGAPTTQPPIPVVIEFMKMQEDEMRIGADLVRIIATAPIAIGDRINTYVIQNVEFQLGLYFATAKRQ